MTPTTMVYHLVSD